MGTSDPDLIFDRWEKTLSCLRPAKITRLRWFYEVTNLSTSLGLVDALRDFSPAAHGDPFG